MKFSISTQDLKTLLINTSSVMSSKATIPILGNFLCEVSGGRLRVTTTDLTITMSCATPVRSAEECLIAVPRRLASLVRELAVAEVHCTVEDEGLLTLQAGSSKFKMLTVRGNEFPRPTSFEGDPSFEMAEREFKDALQRVAFAVAHESKRSELLGVCMELSEDLMVLCGTDAKLVARVQQKLPIPDNCVGSYILPLKSVEELLKVLSGEKATPITISLKKDRVCFATEEMTLVTKLIAGNFPSVKEFITEDVPFKIPLHRKELIDLLRQVSLFTNERQYGVHCRFEKGEIILYAKAMEIGEGAVHMVVDYQGEPFEMIFHPNYFLDVLKHCTQEVVTLCLSDPYNLSLVLDEPSVTSNLQSYSPQYLMMPIRYE